MIRKMQTAVLAVALTLALPALAFADTTAPVAETLTVGSTLTLTGIPSSVSYGTLFGGDAGQAPDISVSANGNVEGGLTLSVDGSDFTTAGGTTLPASIRRWHAEPGDAANVFHTFDAPDTPQIVAQTVAPGAINRTVTLQVIVPTNALAGDYTGTVTFSLAAN